MGQQALSQKWAENRPKFLPAENRPNFRTSNYKLILSIFALAPLVSIPPIVSAPPLVAPLVSVYCMSTYKMFVRL